MKKSSYKGMEESICKDGMELDIGNGKGARVEMGRGERVTRNGRRRGKVTERRRTEMGGEGTECVDSKGETLQDVGVEGGTSVW